MMQGRRVCGHERKHDVKAHISYAKTKTDSGCLGTSKVMLSVFTFLYML